MSRENPNWYKIENRLRRGILPDQGEISLENCLSQTGQKQSLFCFCCFPKCPRGNFNGHNYTEQACSDPRVNRKPLWANRFIITFLFLPRTRRLNGEERRQCLAKGSSARKPDTSYFQLRGLFFTLVFWRAKNGWGTGKTLISFGWRNPDGFPSPFRGSRGHFMREIKISRAKK